jgi:hypothetical protein
MPHFQSVPLSKRGVSLKSNLGEINNFDRLRTPHSVHRTPTPYSALSHPPGPHTILLQYQNIYSTITDTSGQFKGYYPI